MRIAERLHLVMSGALGMDLTDPLDCNVYLVGTTVGWLLFDAGAGRSVDAMLDALPAEAINPSAIAALFLTHGHADQSAGAARLHERFGVGVITGTLTAPMVAGGEEDAISLTAARQAGGYPADFTYRACPVGRTVADGEVVRFGDTSVTAVATPGHSHDHMAFLIEQPGRRILVAGDALFHGGRVGVQNVYDCSVPEICRSVRRLAGLDYEIFLPGHGPFSLRNGRRHADAAMEYVRRNACPPSI
jgi:glyoxylase-like metal-dependent hydrolase (beta-lactamase superfamily II)